MHESVPATSTPDTQLFRDVFSASPIGIVVENLEGQPLYVNPAFCTMLGFSDEEIRRKHCVDFSPPEDAEKDWNFFQQLRAGSIDHYQIEKRYFRRDGSLVWGRLSICLLNGRTSPLVVAMVEEITDKRAAEEALRASEELLRVFVKNVPAAVAMLDRDMCYLQVSDRWCTEYLPGRGQVLGRSHYELFPDMPERWKEVHRRALQGEILRADEDRWNGQDGLHWARWEVHPWKTSEGTVGGILILAEDITRRKQMEEELLGMSRKLIQAQEQERARIGRELHDDINQRLALLAIELDQLQGKPSEFRRRLQDLRKHVAELCNDVQALSHELHSSKLEYLGVVAAMRSWCEEFGKRHEMEIDVRSNISRVLPLNVGQALFRLLQEALHNASKHSGVKWVDVQLREESGEIHLLVSDRGRGFDVEAALQGKGLGLTSMLERVRLLDGAISIESKPAAGTTIRVRVPLASEQDPPRAAA